MRNIIEELYYGNITPCDRDIIKGGTFGSLIYWATKLIAFVAIWAVLYAIIATVQFVIAHWIWFAIGAAIIVATVIAYTTWNRKNPAVA